MTRASRMPGNASRLSFTRIKAVSKKPPKKPAIAPSTVPTMPPSRIVAAPMKNEVRAPTMTRLNTSRPSWSVPNGCESDGAAFLSEALTAVGS